MRVALFHPVNAVPTDDRDANANAFIDDIVAPYRKPKS
jgi:hypothetical protein